MLLGFCSYPKPWEKKPARNKKSPRGQKKNKNTLGIFWIKKLKICMGLTQNNAKKGAPHTLDKHWNPKRKPILVNKVLNKGFSISLKKMPPHLANSKQTNNFIFENQVNNKKMGRKGKI